MVRTRWNIVTIIMVSAAPFLGRSLLGTVSWWKGRELAGLPAVQQQSPDLRIAVTPPEFDDVGSVLTSMGWTFTEIQYEDLQSYETLSEFDMLFISCSTASLLYTGLPDYHSDENIANVEQFVREGGLLYISDFAEVFIEYSFPESIRFYDSTHYGRIQTVEATVVDPDLAIALNRQSLPIEFDTAAWVSVARAPDEATIYLSADFAAMDESRVDDSPLALSFPHGEGRVLYTAFHNGVQTSEDEKTLLSYILADLTGMTFEVAPPSPSPSLEPTSEVRPTLAPVPTVATAGSDGGRGLLIPGIAAGLGLCGLFAVLLITVVILVRRRKP